MTEYMYAKIPDVVWMLNTECYSGGKKLYSVVEYAKDEFHRGFRRRDDNRVAILAEFSSGSLEELQVRLSAAGMLDATFVRSHFNNFAPSFMPAGFIDVSPLEEVVSEGSEES